MNLTGASSNKRLLSSQRSVAKRVRPVGRTPFFAVSASAAEICEAKQCRHHNDLPCHTTVARSGVFVREFLGSFDGVGQGLRFSRIGWRRRTLRTLAHHGLPVRPIPRWQTSGCAGGSAIEPHRCLFARSEAFFASFNGLLAGGHRHAPELLGVSGVYSQYAVLILGAY